jgi:ribosomal protein S15P/S13E
MKVFEVVIEFCRDKSQIIEKDVQYVTSEENTLLSVAEYFAQHCFEYEKDLISVREVLTVVQHIQNVE